MAKPAFNSLISQLKTPSCTAGSLNAVIEFYTEVEWHITFCYIMLRVKKMLLTGRLSQV